MKSILDICKEVADLAATKRPEDLFNQNNLQNNIFLSVLKSSLDSLLRYGDWPELTKEGEIRTFAKQDKYFMNEVCPDFYSLINNTIYIKDSGEKVIGAITPEDWMREKYFSSEENGIKFKFQNGMIKFLTPPPADLKIVFQYRSNAVCIDAKTFEEKSCVSKNNDIPIFDAYLVKLGVLWRWLKRNGLNYVEEFSEYEREIKKKFASSLALKDINLSAISDDAVNMGVTINVKPYK